LEGLANHRGSSFGKLPGGQPSQIDFENRLSIALLRRANEGCPAIYLEDEGHLIGRCALPQTLNNKMKEAPVLVLESSFEERVDRGVKDYVEELHGLFLQQQEEGEAFDRLEQHLNDSLYRIRRRLGGERHSRLDAVLKAAIVGHRGSGSLEGYL